MKSHAIYWVVIAALAGALAWTRLGGGGHKSEAEYAETPDHGPAVAVSLYKAEMKTSSNALEAVGTVNAETRAAVSAKIMGYISELSADVGDRVEKGQTLAVLYADEISARVQRARAGRQEAEAMANEIEASISELEAGMSELDSNILAAESQEAKAAAGLGLAQKTHDRFERLWDDKSVSRQEFDEAIARLAAARADHDAAARAVEAARSKRVQLEKKKEQIETRRSQVKARIAQAESGLNEALAYKAYMKVESPIDGVVTERAAEPGQLAAPGQPLFMLSGADAFNLEADAPEAIAGRLSVGMKVESVVGAGQGKRVEGEIVEIAPQADPISRTVRVKIRLPEGEGWKNGQFARVLFPGEASEKILVPKTALTERGQLQAVFKADEDGLLKLRAVRVGAEAEGGMVEILGGLEPGDRIVADASAEGLREGRAWTEM